MKKRLKIATRKSPLALWQAEYVRDRLLAEHSDLEVELVKMSTKGDKILDTPLAKIGGKGLFVKELEQGMLDPECLAITGGSYGGYLTAWIIGHDQRFAAAVAQRGVYHLLAFHGTTDIPLFMASNMKAEPWEEPERFWQYSPLAYAHHITTPLLIIHSEEDMRVPISEGEQLFAMVKRVGKAPVQMVRYPREGHELSRAGEPAHIVDRLKRIVAWWDTYCKVEEGAAGG